MSSIQFLLLVLTFIYLQISCLAQNSTKKNYTINANYTSYFINSTIRTLNEKNFDSVVNYNHSINYLVLFTFRRCTHCNKVISIIENVEKYYSSKKDNILNFAKLDCYSSGWTAMRFDIFQIPVFVYITNGFFATFTPKNYTEEELIEFIESIYKDFKVFPKKIGYFGVFMKVFHLMTMRIQKNIPFWNELCSWGVLSILFGSFLYFEYSICKACLDSNKDNNKNLKKEKNSHHHNKKNSKKKDYIDEDDENDNKNEKNENNKLKKD